MGKSKTKTTENQSSTSGPLAWQSSAIQNAFGNAQNIYNQQASATQPNWNTYTGLNNIQTGALNNAVTNTQNQSNLGDSLMNTGSGLLSNGASGTSNLNGAAGVASQFANGNFNQGSTATSNAVSGTGSQYANQGLSNLQNASTLANTDATAQNTADATAYANSSGVQNAIKAANAYADQMYQRTTGTDLNAAAVAGGNLNSSRAGAASAVSQALQNAQDENNAASMYSSAYNTGLSTAEQARQANLSGLLNGASTGISGANSAVDAQQAGNSQVNTNNALQQSGASLLSNIGSNQVGAASTGSNIASSGADLQNTANTNQYNAGTAYQSNSEAAKQADVSAYQNQQANQWSQLQNLWNIISTRQWGGTSSGTATKTETGSPSLMSMIQGGIGTIAGLTQMGYNSFGGSSGSGSSNPFSGSGTSAAASFAV